MATLATAKALSVWEPQIVRRATGDSFRKLHPRTMARNPVMFVVEAGSVLTTWRLIQDAITGQPGLGFELQITLWLWLTVLFANFAEAMAEGRQGAGGYAAQGQDGNDGEAGTSRRRPRGGAGAGVAQG